MSQHWEQFPEEPAEEIESSAYWCGYYRALELARGIVEQAEQERELFRRLRERAGREIEERGRGLTRQERAFWLLGAVVVVMLVWSKLTQ